MALLLLAISGCGQSYNPERDKDCPAYDLVGVQLESAKLSRADLAGANLRGASLSYADFAGAGLSEAKLYEADLTGANLSEADLAHADLQGADLTDANLTDTNLYKAYTWTGPTWTVLPVLTSVMLGTFQRNT